MSLLDRITLDTLTIVEIPIGLVVMAMVGALLLASALWMVAADNRRRLVRQEAAQARLRQELADVRGIVSSLKSWRELQESREA